MQTIAMTPEERHQFNQLVRRVDKLEDTWKALDKKIDSILSIVKGIAIGIIIGGIIFGIFSLKDIIDAIK